MRAYAHIPRLAGSAVGGGMLADLVGCALPHMDALRLAGLVAMGAQVRCADSLLEDIQHSCRVFARSP